MELAEEHKTKFRTFLKGDIFHQRIDGIMAGHPLILRTPQDEQWEMSVNEIEKILREYAPELSAVVDGAVIVIFHEVEK